jgi:hypothetical protein
VVGYVKEDYGNRVAHTANTVGGGCVSCGRDVYFNSSGAAAVKDRDALPICQRCRIHHLDEILAKEL